MFSMPWEVTGWWELSVKLGMAGKGFGEASEAAVV
jgi:hypothetical protein